MDKGFKYMNLFKNTMKNKKLFLMLGIGVLLIGSLLILDNRDKNDFNDIPQETIKFYSLHCSNGECKMIDSAYKYAIDLYGEEVAKNQQDFFNKINLEGSL
jgi:hypothetical protein